MMNEKKITHAAAHIINKNIGNMYHLKLIKILYLADRESMNRYGSSITDDSMVSMDNGPVLSNTLNLINGYFQSKINIWESWISAKEKHQVSLKNDISRADLDELSDSDIDVLDYIWSKFGSMDRWELCDYTHKNCKEWQDPNGSSIPISNQEVFQALGKSEEEIAFFCDEICRNDKINDLFASL